MAIFERDSVDEEVLADQLASYVASCE